MPIAVRVKGKRDRPRFGCALAIFVFFLGLGVGALVYGGLGYHEDLNWNAVVNGQRKFPSVENCSYFEGKTFRLPPDLLPLRVNLQRNATIDKIFLFSTSICLFIAWILLCCGRPSTIFKFWFLVGGFVNLVNGIIMIRLIINGYSNENTQALNELDLYSKTPSGSYAAQNVIEMFVLRQAVNACHGNSTVDHVTIGEETCQQLGLIQLGFCQRYELKFVAAIFAFLMAALCWITFGFACWCGYWFMNLKVVPINVSPSVTITGIRSSTHQNVGKPHLSYCPAYPPFNAGDDLDNHNEPFTISNILPSESEV